MRLCTNSQYTNNYQPNFNGTIKQTRLFKDYALEYARGIKVTDPEWSKLKIFINTIRAIKADKSADEFIIETRKVPKEQLWYIKYGDYLKQSEYFKNDFYNGKNYGQEVLAEDVFKKVVQFGKEYFGLPEVSKPIEEFAPADKYLKNANNFFAKSRKTKDRDTINKLMENSKREEQKADEAIAAARTRILTNI